MMSDYLSGATTGSLATLGVLAGLFFAAFMWVRRQIISAVLDSKEFRAAVIDAVLKAKEFFDALDSWHTETIQTSLLRITQEIREMVDEHNHSDDAHRTALKRYAVREYVADKIDGLDKVLVAVQEQIRQIAFDLRSGGTRTADGPIVPKS